MKTRKVICPRHEETKQALVGSLCLCPTKLHTMTPWKLQYNCAWSEGFKDRGPIFTCALKTGTHVPEDQNVINAAFIVRAVNSHEELLEVMRDVAGMLPVSARLHPDDLRKLQTRVVEAIAKAEGRTEGL